MHIYLASLSILVLALRPFGLAALRHEARWADDRNASTPVPHTRVYDRSVHMVYALNDKLGMPNTTDQQFLDAFDEGKVTALVPFFLNVLQPQMYDSMIQAVQSRGIIIVPAIGGPPASGDLDMQTYKDMAVGYKNYSDYVRLENLQGFYDEYGSNGTQNLINYCVQLGYKHIMMNPWPNTPNGSLVPFPNPEIDSAFNAVSINQTNATDPKDWKVQLNPILQDRAVRPNMPILINYESPGPQQILTQMEMANKGSSIAAMNITVSEIIGEYLSYDLHWAPPLTQSYNSIALGTWSWIARELKTISRVQRQYKQNGGTWYVG